MLSSSAALAGADPSKLSTHLNSVRMTYRVYEWLAVTDANGRIVASTDSSDLGSDQTETQWYRTARASDAVYVQEVAAPGRGLGERAVLFARRIPDEIGAHGVVALRS